MERTSFRHPQDPKRPVLYGFFHPYANNGGGGEKVLWNAVASTLSGKDNNIAIIYTTNTDASPSDIVNKAATKFNVVGLAEERIVFIYLTRFGRWIDASQWKHFTLVGQLLGSALLATEALWELSPDVWIDTMGLPGSYWPVSMLLHVPIMAYVHYPIIQEDMFNKLKVGRISEVVSVVWNPLLARDAFKFCYWSVLYTFYRYLGRCVDVIFANGTWTCNHLKRVWALDNVEVVYPPCSVEKLTEKRTSSPREETLLYIAQFRPEKRHLDILRGYRDFITQDEVKDIVVPKLVFLGSCRTVDDSGTLNLLQSETKKMGLGDHVTFIVDCSFDEVKRQLSLAKFGVNAMWNEHFGIGVVEYMSAGVIPIVHASAGPLLDILKTEKVAESWYNEVGFFFKCLDDPDFSGSPDDSGNLVFPSGSYPDFAGLLHRLYVENTDMVTELVLAEMREKGQKLMLDRFSDSIFATRWERAMEICAKLDSQKRGKDKVERVY